MSTNTITIEDRLRAKAQQELKTEIERLVKPLEDLLYEASWPRVTVEVEGAKKQESPSQLLGAVTKAAYEALLIKRGNRAVEAFLAKVDSLQNQIDELLEAVDHD